MRTIFLKLFGQQLAGVGIFYLALFFAGLLPPAANIALTAVLGVGGMAGYILCNHKNVLDGLWLFPFVFAAAAGFGAGIYFCTVGSAYFENALWLVPAAAVALLECVVSLPAAEGRAKTVQNAAGTLVPCAALAISVWCFCNWNAEFAVFWREGAFLFLFLFALLLGQVAYLWLGGDVRHKMNLAFCAAFFVVLFVVLLVLTEGDAGDAAGDLIGGAVGDTDGSPRRKRRAGRQPPQN